MLSKAFVPSPVCSNLHPLWYGQIPRRHSPQTLKAVNQAQVKRSESGLTSESRHQCQHPVITVSTQRVLHAEGGGGGGQAVVPQHSAGLARRQEKGRLNIADAGKTEKKRASSSAERGRAEDGQAIKKGGRAEKCARNSPTRMSKLVPCERCPDLLL